MKKYIVSVLAFVLLSIFSTNGQNIISYDSFDPGYRGTIETGYSYGLGRDRSNMVSILTTHGFAFSPIVFVGIGSGVDMLMYNEFNGYSYKENLYLIPLYADLKLNLFSRGVAPYLDFRIGSTFLCNKEQKYGYSDRYDEYFFTESLYFSPSFGVRIPVGEKSAFNIGVTYTLICNGLGRSYYDDYYYDYNYNSGYRKSNLTINSVGGRIAFEF